MKQCSSKNKNKNKNSSSISNMKIENLARLLEVKQRELQQRDLYNESEQAEAFTSSCHGLPFYRWDLMMSNETLHNQIAVKSNYTCCFNHKIGLPEKNGVKHSLYPYEHLIFKELMKASPNNT